MANPYIVASLVTNGDDVARNVGKSTVGSLCVPIVDSRLPFDFTCVF